jgi:ABC-type multidrug transport system fused ATPase/permease subunit
MYALWGALVGISAAISIWFFLVFLLPISANRLHHILLNAVMHAPYSFFFSTDSGVTLNRFSQDMTLVDNQLPVAMWLTMDHMFELCVEIGLIASGSKYFAALVPVCLFCVYLLQAFYLRTSRQLRLLDLEAKSPLYTHFTETLAGLATIRAFNWQSAFQAKNRKYLDSSQKPYYLMFCIQRWLNLVLDLFVAGMAVVLIALSTQIRSSTTSAAIGLSMLNILSFSKSLTSLITYWTQLETSLGAVARLKEFERDTPSEDLPQEKRDVPPQWPSKGEVEIKDLVVGYKPDLPPAISNVSLTIRPGQKIGLVGRTGSGKSSTLLAVLRLLEISKGSIIVDGVDLSLLPRQAIRDAMITIPQEPVLLPGSVAENLDRDASLPEFRIKDVLSKVGLLAQVESKGGVSAPLDSLNLSAGQKQLLSLAAAMLRKEKSNILILDEATSFVDAATERMMMDVIGSEFAGHTVISVAHHLKTVRDFDTVVVMDAGKVAEFGSPDELLKREGGMFKKLWDSAE